MKRLVDVIEGWERANGWFRDEILERCLRRHS